MINCKKHIIAASLALMLPLIGWAEAPVVDDSDNFAIIDGQQANESPVVDSKYDEPIIENSAVDNSRNQRYSQNDDGPALVKDDSANNASIDDGAKLIDKIQSLQQEVQELRGQLEVQGHDLKLLQQQQLAFYKDLDARLGSAANKPTELKQPANLGLVNKKPTYQPAKPNVVPTKPTAATKAPLPIIPVSRANPADEQISYLAAYELVKNKRYDDGIQAMQTFVQKYPKGGYTANAQYWLGELYMVKKEYAKAIEHFEVVLQQFPSSSKSAASMLKLGYAFAATGDNQEAKRRFQQVVRTYPDTPTAKLASQKLANI